MTSHSHKTKVILSISLVTTGIVGFLLLVLFLDFRNPLAEEARDRNLSTRKQVSNPTVTMVRQDSLLFEPGTFSPADTNSDGVNEALVANVDVEIVTPGMYLVRGVLSKNGRVIAIQPSIKVSIFTEDTIGEQPGLYTVTLRFSGEQIFQSGEDGPYDVEIVAFSEGTVPISHIVATPAYAHTEFGELR